MAGNVVGQENPYLPQIATIKRIVVETGNIKSFYLVLNGTRHMENFAFEPGQVAQLSLFGVGEATFGLANSPTRRETLQFSVMKAGEVTSALHELAIGDYIGLRGPLGNWFPYPDMKGKNVVIIGGGIGIAPLRSLIQYILDTRDDYDEITIIYGARSPQDLCYEEDREEWEKRDDVNLILTVDKEFPEWDKRVGFVPTVLKEVAPSPKNAVAVTCGPPIMIKLVLQELQTLGFEDDQIITTLEKRMKCGIGKCGRCNIGPKYVCVDGPVFSLAQLKQLPNEL